MDLRPISSADMGSVEYLIDYIIFNNVAIKLILDLEYSFYFLSPL